MIQDFFINRCLNSRIQEHPSSLHGDYRIHFRNTNLEEFTPLSPNRTKSDRERRWSWGQQNHRAFRLDVKYPIQEMSAQVQKRPTCNFPNWKERASPNYIRRRDGPPTHPPKLSEFERNNRNGEKTSKWHIFKSGSFRIMITRPDSRLFLILQHFSQLQGVVSPFLEITIELSWLLLKLRSGRNPWRIIFQFP